MEHIPHQNEWTKECELLLRTLSDNLRDETMDCGKVEKSGGREGEKFFKGMIASSRGNRETVERDILGRDMHGSWTPPAGRRRWG